MQIASIVYVNAEQNRVAIVADGVTLSSPWPIQSYHRELVASWLAANNEIGPYIASVPSTLKIYSKARLFDAMTNNEFTIWKQAEGTFPARHLAIFNHAAEIRSDHHLFPILRSAMLNAYGEARTNTLFAASEA